MCTAIAVAAMVGIALLITQASSSLVIAECELENATERRGRLLVTIVDSSSGAARRGSVCSLYRKSSVPRESHTNARAALQQYFSSSVARAACNHAGFASACDAFAIPNYRHAPSSHHRAVIDSLACPTSAGATLDSCDFELADSNECTASFDAGVVCPRPHFATAPNAPRNDRVNVTMYTAYSSLLSVRLLDVLRESLQNLLGHAAVEQMHWEEFENVASAVPYSAVKFYVSEDRSAGVHRGNNDPASPQILYDPVDIEFALSSYAQSPETVSEFFLCSLWLVESHRPRGYVQVAPNQPPWAVVGGTPNHAAEATGRKQTVEEATPVTSDSRTRAANWSVRIVGNLGASSTTGRVELRRPGSATWARACMSPPSMSVVVALCKGALHLPQEAPWPYALPSFVEQPISNVAVRSSDFIALQFDDLGGSPADSSLSEILLGPLSTQHCSPVIVNCLRSIVEVTEDRLLTAVVSTHDFLHNFSWFSTGWSYSLPLGLNFVVADIHSIASADNFTYVNFTFASLSAGGSSANESSCTSAQWNCSHPAGSSTHGSGAPGNGSSAGGSAQDSGSTSSRPSGGGSVSNGRELDVSKFASPVVEGGDFTTADDPVTSYIDDGDGFLYVGTTTRLAAWYAARRMPYANISGFGTLFEIWDNTSQHSADVNSVDRSLRQWRWGTQQTASSLQLIDVLSADELQRGLRGEGAPMLGRPEVTLGTSATWGTIASDGMASQSVKALCAALGAPTTPSTLLSTEFVGTGPVYLSDFRCSNTGEDIPQCDYVVSPMYDKQNWATHHDAVNILCGSLRPNYASSMLTFTLVVDDQTPDEISRHYNKSTLSAMVQCYEERAGFGTSRLTLQGVTLDTRNLSSFNNGTFVKMNVSVSPRRSATQFSSGDILLVGTTFGDIASNCFPFLHGTATAVILQE